MTTQDNINLTRQLIDEFTRGDLAAVGSHFADDAVWELPGRSPVAGEYKGPEAIVGFLAKAYELSAGTLRLEVIDVRGSEQGSVQVQHVRADNNGRNLDCVELLAHDIVDGKITHTYHRPDQYAIDTFFA